MSQTPSISVVVPTYNGATFLGEALDSVFAQTLRPAEVLVVDDASTDATPELVEQKARTAPIPTRLIRLERNSGGPARPLNVGVAAAGGEFIAVLDQDDVFAPEKLEVQASILAREAELAVVCSFCAALHDQTKLYQTPEVQAELREGREVKPDHWRFTSRQMLGLLLRHTNFFMGYPGFLFRRADWQRKGSADESLRISSDYDFLCWLALQGPVAVVPHVHYYRRDHEANLCKRGRELYVDIMRVKARWVAQERWVLDDPILSRQLRDELFGLAYWVREAGRSWESLHYHVLASRLWGWDGRTVWAVAKLLPSWLLGLFGRRSLGSHA